MSKLPESFYRNPMIAQTITNQRDFHRIMKETGGRVFVNKEVWEIRNKNISDKHCRVWLSNYGKT